MRSRSLCRTLYFAFSALLLPSAGCGHETVAVDLPDNPDLPGGTQTVVLSVKRSPANPTTTTAVTLNVTASDTNAVATITISVDSQTVRSCAGGRCTYTSTFLAGEHTYLVEGSDTTDQRLDAVNGIFTVLLSPPVSSPGTSPLWQHMRTSTIDYRIHYQKGAQQTAEYDFAASHYDYVVGGTVNEYKRRNPMIRQMVYDLFYGDEIADVVPFESWLTTNGYNVENAYLHKAGGIKTKADRVTYLQWKKDYYAYNLSDPGFRAWRKRRTQNLTSVNAKGYRADGLFLDVLSTGGINKAIPTATLEYPDREAYYSELRDLLAEHRQYVPAGYLNINAATYFNKPADQANASAAGGIMTEFANSPYYEQKWSFIDALVRDGVVVEYSTGVRSSAKNTPSFDMTPGNYASVRERVLMFEYASYLMVVEPTNMDAVLFETYGASWSVPMDVTWLKAFEYNIGLATGPRYQLQTGKDPAGQSAQVMAREFENGLAVIRARNGSGTTKFGDQTAVTVDLPPGTWRQLRPDGLIAQTMTEVQLRNGESAIFVK
jgi:hypothetical protein